MTKAEAHRRRVFKRTVFAVALALVALLALRLWWGHEAARLLQAEIDSYHAAGEPILVEDFALEEAVPDEENAAILYRQAWAALVRETNSSITFDDAIGDPRTCAAYPDDVRIMLEANEEPLRLLREARDLPCADWGIRVTSPIIDITLPMLFEQRRLSQLARTAAVFQHQQGDHAEAVETLRDIQAMAAKLPESSVYLLVSHLVTLAIDCIAIDGLEMIAPTLATVDGKTAEEPSDRPATRARIEELVSTLLDEESIRSGWRNGMYAERALELDSMLMLTSARPMLGGLTGAGTGPALGPLLGRIIRPMFDMDAARMMRHTSRILEAGLAPNWSIAQRLSATDQLPDSNNEIERMTHLLSGILVPSFDRSLTLHFRTLAMRRMAATALAIRLYELDCGARPASLDGLVPDYLSELPMDPFADDGRTFGYKPDARPPILYSIADDGKDDGGQYVLAKRGSIDREQKDMPFFLNGDRPRPPLELRSDD